MFASSRAAFCVTSNSKDWAVYQIKAIKKVLFSTEISRLKEIIRKCEPTAILQNTAIYRFFFA